MLNGLKILYHRIFGEDDPILKQKYYAQIRKDTEAINQPLTICLVIFIIVETSRVLASELALLRGEIRWPEVFSRLAFSILIAGTILFRFFFQKASSPFLKRIEKTGIIISIAIYCGIISTLLIQRVDGLTNAIKEHRDNFDFMALGLLVIPNLIISDVVFNRWLEKCVLPIWEMTNLAVIVVYYQPLNWKALLVKIFTYSFYIVLVFWIKEKIRWRVFLQRQTLKEWTKIHEKILESVPDNVAVYNFHGEVLFKNEFLKDFEETIKTRDIIRAVTNIKRRADFTSTQSLIERQKPQSNEAYFRVNLDDNTNSPQSTEVSLLNDCTFRSLPELFEMIQKVHSNVIIPGKDLLIFDAKCDLLGSGKTISLEIRLSIFEGLEDNKKKFLVILRDTTKRDIMATLESNNRFKDNMLASISHEIRTPLNGITSMIDSCLNDPGVSSKVKETYILPASRSATFLNFITNYILDYSLLTHKKLHMKFQTVEIKKLLQNCYDLIKSHYYKQKIEFKLEIDDDLPQYIRTDPERLTQVILSLLSNAFKFTKKGTITFKADMNNSNIRITVKDTGVGMNDESIEKLVNIFAVGMAGEKVDANSTGIGLGLTISQAICSLLGPENASGLYFDSTLNVGTKFTFVIEDKETSVSPTINPRKIPKLNLIEKQIGSGKKNLTAKKPLEETSFASPTQVNSVSLDEGENRCYETQSAVYRRESSYLPSYASRKNISEVRLDIPVTAGTSQFIEDDSPDILVVDDEPINLLAFEMISKQLKKSIDKAYGAEEALEMIEKRKLESDLACPKTYKVIFMDLNMPSINGYEATRRIKEKVKNKEIQDIVIIACTAYTEQEHKQKCLEAGMSDFINKPVTKAKIAEMLQKHQCT